MKKKKLKMLSSQSFVILFFAFAKIGSIAPVDQQIKLVSSHQKMAGKVFCVNFEENF